MSCKICGSSACTECFHRLEEQEAFEQHELGKCDHEQCKWYHEDD